MDTISWIIICFFVFCIGIGAGFYWCAVSTVELLKRKGLSRKEMKDFFFNAPTR